MFICQPCQRENDVNVFSIIRSLGACEVCGRVDVCADIHHSRLPQGLRASTPPTPAKGGTWTA